jgi:hypothetical protein
MMHISLLATLTDAATNPAALAVLVAGLSASALIALGPPARDLMRRAASRLRGRSDAGAADTAGRARPATPAAGDARIPMAALAYGALGLALLGATGWAFTEPATRARTVERTRFEHVMSIGYVARGAPSTLLADGVVTPVSAETVKQMGGQPPLYSALLSKIDVGINYELRSPEPLSVMGFGGVALRIKAQEGWERTLAPLPAKFLSGPKVTMWSVVDLDAVRLVIAGVEFATGSKSDWYDLTLVPVVRLAGQLGDAHIDETYAPEFRWRYAPVRITPDDDLARSEKHTERSTVHVTNHAGAFGLMLKVSVARWVLLACTTVALGGAGLLILSVPAKTRERVGSAAAAPVDVVIAPPSPAVAQGERDAGGEPHSMPPVEP